MNGLSSIKTISDMQENAQGLLKEAQNSNVVIYHRSKPKAVLISMDEYQKLKDMAEEVIDSKKAHEYEKMDKKKVKWMLHDEVKKLAK